MAWHGQTILKTLMDGAKLTRELAEACGITDVKTCLRHLRARGFMTSSEGVHTITDSGREALKNNVKLTAGPCPREAQARQRRTLRDKAWAAMQRRDFFSVAELLFLLLSDGDNSKNAQQNLQEFATALEKAGFLMRKKGKGPRRYRLRPEMNTGPLAPAWNKATRLLTDANTGKRYAIPAGGVKAAA